MNSRSLLTYLALTLSATAYAQESQSPSATPSPYDAHPECRDIRNPPPPEVCQEYNGPAPRVVRGAQTQPQTTTPTSPPKPTQKPVLGRKL